MPKINLKFGDVREKKIKTLNDFISHMVEHIAWRLNTKIELYWDNKDWHALGKCLGEKIRDFEPNKEEAVALGMIDDGSCEVFLDLTGRGLSFTSVPAVNLDWFLGCRCEQLKSGKPLLDLLKGLARGLKAGLQIKVWSFEDPHHTWEAIFRGVGTSLGKIYTPKLSERDLKNEIIKNKSSFSRTTAETKVKVDIDFGKQEPNQYKVNVADSIDYVRKNMGRLLDILSRAGDFTVQVDFGAKKLSSSHVVMEDIGQVLGRALFKMLKFKMEKQGVKGAGSNLQILDDLKTKPMQVGISVEGRKFCKFVPFDGNYQNLRKNLLVGKNVMNTLRSEDLDDFIDGLAGGMNASIIVHIKKFKDAESAWQWIFRGLGRALQEVFELNPYRKGVPPGVKATLV